MAADQTDADALAGFQSIVKNFLGQRLRGEIFGQKQCREIPQRPATFGGDVVGIDVDGVPTDLIGGESNRVGFGDQVTRAASINNRGVFANAGTDDDAAVLDLVLLEQPL